MVKKSWIVVGLVVVAGVVGVGAFWAGWGDRSAELPRYSHDGQRVPDDIREKFRRIQDEHATAEAVVGGPSKERPNDRPFRSTLSELAWGRKGRKAAGVAPSDGGESILESAAEREMLKSRTEYCLKNRGKDPSCP